MFCPLALRRALFEQWKLAFVVKVIFEEWDWHVHHTIRIEWAEFRVAVQAVERRMPDADDEVMLVCTQSRFVVIDVYSFWLPH